MVETSDEKDTVVRSQGALRGQDSPPVTMQYVYTEELQFFMLLASHLALLLGVYPYRYAA